MRSALWKLFALLLSEAVFGEKVQVTLAAGADDLAAVTDTYYTAGVVEFRPTIAGATSADMLQEHLQAYIDIMHSAEANETDIIVFPEGTLNNQLQLTYVPDGRDNVIPCRQHDEYAEFLVQLSCAVRNISKYVVINLTEKENCTTTLQDTRPCANNGLNVYNSNVVFDREGRVVSRYRKVHVYVENKNTTLQPEFGIFETDFGVRFGHFICFDMLFYTPAQELVVRHGITDFIFTSWFYSELPFLTAVQLQQSWAWGNNVNLLAAGASYPAAGITGSGIYAGVAGDLLSVMVGGDVGERKLYVSRVPKMSSKAPERSTSKVAPYTSRVPQTGIKLMKDPQIANFTSELLNFDKEPSIVRRLCISDFCCQFKVVTTRQVDVGDDTLFYKYRIGVFNGQRTYEKAEWSDLQICALYTCTDEHVASCGEMLNASATLDANFYFESIQIEGNFVRAEKLLIMPTTLNDQLYSLNANILAWQLSDHSNNLNVQFSLLSAYHDTLLTFGIYANYYDRSAASVLSSRHFTTQSVLLCCVIFTVTLSVLGSRRANYSFLI